MDDKSKLIQDIMEDVENDMSDEEIIHMLLDKKISTKVISKQPNSTETFIQANKYN